ncbi:autotransporter outer membrane beta-barrel domain-containing protein [Collimonas sp. OK412]|jgi:outer membrane autotransporter protein|uniref:autotransporter family protein n=1 Tax=Collimonas sp. (strain OK412) TaxID=1801619 RepID=UPI0008E4DCC5|nr:autotransporter outer membrane beta-barrel domain-containing protein [Collimonas sp. OK412]SFC73050.1 outer membrane autotransporter barrel domain-containing protein [Collimonas sp. OK412]
MSHPVRYRFALSAASSLLLIPVLSMKPGTAYAACSTSGQSTICDASAANPWTTSVGRGNLAAEDGRTVTVGAGSRIAVGDTNAISLRDNADITLQNGGTVSANGVRNAGLYKNGANTIEFRNNSTLTVDQGGQVLATGTEITAEAVNPQGSGNFIINNGTIRADHAVAVWFQNTSGLNTIINNETGVIQAPGNVIGASGNGAVDFTNKGRIIGDLVFSGGDDTLRLYTGSVITGKFDGGKGNNTLFLSGTGSASLSGDMINFSSFIKNDAGTWTLTTPITGVRIAEVQQGTLALTANNSAYAGKMTVDAAGTLEARAQTLPLAVVNNGLVRFAQPDNGTYTGFISGAGALEKTLGGTLVLAPAAAGGNTYSGGTIIAAGILAVGDASHANAALSGGGSTVISSGATLAGYGSVTGPVTNGGTVAVANALSAFANSGNGAFTINGTLVNAGVVQIGGQGVGNRLNVVGNYVGQNGSIALNTYLAGDGAASDRLVISGGTASGSSSLRITNVGGPGAAIVADGIEVVQSVNGATTTASAFALAAPVKAGAYAYYLAKGGVTSGTSENWYLRNTVTQTPAPPVVVPPTTTLGAPPATPSTSSVAIPLYRPEVPIYAEVASIARQVNIQQLDNFHDRQGEQSLLTENGELPAAWGRVWGSHTKQRQDGTVSPQFDGSMTGMQVGHDIYADTSASGRRNHYGLFLGYAHATGNVNGFAMAVQNLDVGNLAIDAYSLGGYWTHVGPSGWYTDAVLMGSSLSADPRSHDGVGAHTHGSALIGSIEGGLPIPLGADVTIEPQAQVIWQNQSFNNLNDGVSTVSFNNGNTFLARLGVRLQSRFDTAAAIWQPYLRLNLLRSSGSHDTTTFDGTTVISSGTNQTAGQLNAGLVATINKSASAFVTATYTTNLGGAQQRMAMVDAGMRWSW